MALTPESQKALMDILKVKQPESVAAPLSPYEAIQADRGLLSTDPVISKLQKLGRGVKSLLEPETPLDYLSMVVPSGKLITQVPNKLLNLKNKGFDIDKPLYHGSEKSFKTFDPSMIGKRDKGFYGKGFYFTPFKKEAEVYGPNVEKYYVKGNILNLEGSSELGRVFDSSADVAQDAFSNYKKWAKELNKINALPPIQKSAYKDFLKAEKYFNDNLQMIPTSKVKSGIAKGQTIYKAKIKDPYYDDTIKIDDTWDEQEIKEVFFSKAKKNPAFPNLKYMEKRLSNVVRDLDDLEYNEGIDDVAEFISSKAKKAGYSGINAGSETVIFDPKNIIKSPKWKLTFMSTNIK